jgi:hypothetical protein
MVLFSWRLQGRGNQKWSPLLPKNAASAQPQKQEAKGSIAPQIYGLNPQERSLPLWKAAVGIALLLFAAMVRQP